MWFALSVLALLMLSSRRAAEKKAATGIDSMAMAWLQQSVAMPLVIVGVTYTVNMLATYQAKVTAPNQAYVGSIKAASVLPVVALGVVLFHEKVTPKQWAGIGCMLAGLAAMAITV